MTDSNRVLADPLEKRHEKLELIDTRLEFGDHDAYCRWGPMWVLSRGQLSHSLGDRVNPIENAVTKVRGHVVSCSNRRS